MNELTLSSAEREHMRSVLGERTTDLLLQAARTPPRGELTGRPDPKVQGAGRYLTEVEDPRTGNLKRLDPTILERMALDPQLGAALEIVKLPVLSLKPEILHSDPEAQAFLQHELDRDWYGLMRDLLLALEYGFSVMERVWTMRDTRIEDAGRVVWSGKAAVYDKLKAIHPSGVQFTFGPHGEVLGFEQISGGTATVPIEKTLRYTHAQRFGNPYGNPRTRRAYQPWWWSQLIYQFTNRYFEDQSIPQRKIYYKPDQQPLDPSDADGDLHDQALEDALAIAEDSRAGASIALPLQTTITPDGVEKLERGWDIEYLLGPNRQAEFTAYLDHLDLKKMRAMFVPEKLTNQSGPGATGSYAMMDSITSFFLLGEEALAADLLDVITREWARPLLDYNFGPSTPDASFAPVTLSDDNKAFLQDFFKTTMASVLMGGGPAPRIDLDAFAEQLGVPLIQPEGDGVTDQEPSEDAPVRIPTPTYSHVHTATCQHDHTMELADIPGLRKARHGREWESATKDFQEALGESYRQWKHEVLAALKSTEPALREITLNAKLAELARELRRHYRRGVTEAARLGYGDEPTPDELRRVAQALTAAEDRIQSKIIPQLRAKLTPDLLDAGVDPGNAIELRMRIVTDQAGSDYWDTIHQGWAQSRREREADPEVRVGRIRWVLDPYVKQHCPDCPERAGVYSSLDDLPSIPGDGGTDCGIYCRCWLEEEDPESGAWRRRVDL